MRIRFWGARGSIPTPLSPSGLRSKISAVVQRIGRRDIESPEARELFLASLPEYLFSTVGGNTSCVEILSSERDRIIFDAGTGIRELGAQIAAAGGTSGCHIFFSHFHWDHIQGLPFFEPAFDSRNSIDFYSPRPDFRRILESQMMPPFFPITMDQMRAEKRFHVLGSRPLRLGAVEISHRVMDHPGGCYSYRVSENGVKAIYATDTELREEDFLRSPENSAFFQDADILIIDAQYTLGEALEKNNWGHSSFSLAADFAVSWGIKRIALFHHEPAYDDKKIHGMFKNALWYLERLESRGVKAYLAREGLEIEI